MFEMSAHTYPSAGFKPTWLSVLLLMAHSIDDLLYNARVGYAL